MGLQRYRIPELQRDEWRAAVDMMLAAHPPGRWARFRLAGIVSRAVRKTDILIVGNYLHALLIDELMNERGLFKTCDEVAALAALIDSRWRETTGAQSSDLTWLLYRSGGYGGAPWTADAWARNMIWQAAALNAFAAARHERWDGQRKQERLKELLDRMREALSYEPPNSPESTPSP